MTVHHAQPLVPRSASSRRWDTRTAMVIASASGALPMLAIALIEPSFLRPGALPVLTAIVAFTALTVAIAVHAGRLTEIQFTILGSGGMLGVAISAYLIADPAGTRAVTSMLAVVPAIAASGSPPRVTAALTTASMAMAITLSTVAMKSSGIAVTIIAVGAAVTAVLVPVTLILALRRSITVVNQRLETLANTDPLTGLLNRRGLLAATGAMLRKAADQGVSLTAVVVDVDHFKTVNDTHGHTAGDHVLVAVARILEQTSAHPGQPASIVARIGGEEFLLLVPGEHPTLATIVVDTVRATSYVTVSAGSVTVEIEPAPHGTARVARTHDDRSATNSGATGESPLSPARPGVERAVDSMVRAADRGLYAAKTAGRDRAHHCGAITLTDSTVRDESDPESAQRAAPVIRR
ncbi:GGDEF domain-containing protein [Rhodococcus sp. 15-1154-1]|nr:GGDEF domain-containing protein [Rhodococcus sp. 15-1154-1]